MNYEFSVVVASAQPEIVTIRPREALPEGNAASVAELALFLMIGSGRNVPAMGRSMAAGSFEVVAGKSLFGATVLIVGFGRIGRELARLLEPFGCEIVAVTRTERTGEQLAEGPARRLVSIADLRKEVAGADFMALTLPLEDSTRGVIDVAVLRNARPDLRVVNVSRGALIDRAALIEAMRAGAIGAVGLDVFWEEPLPRDDELFSLDALMTPNCAGVTDYCISATAQLCAQNIRLAVSGSVPLYGV